MPTVPTTTDRCAACSDGDHDDHSATYVDAGGGQIACRCDFLGCQLERLENEVAALKREVSALLPLSGATPATIPQDCPCSRGLKMSQERHDWLLSVEERGLPGIVELIGHFSLQVDCEYDTAAELGWYEFTQFVAMHSWQNQTDMYDLANHIDFYCRIYSRATGGAVAK